MGAVYCQLVTFEGPMATEQAGGLFLNSLVEVLKSSLLRTAVISQQEKKKYLDRNICLSLESQADIFHLI